MRKSLTVDTMNIFRPEGLIDNLYQYVETKVALAKVEVQEQIEGQVQRIAKVLGLLLIAFLALLFALMGLALWLNRVSDSTFAGFLMVSGLLLLVGIGVGYTIRGELKKPETNEM